MNTVQLGASAEALAREFLESSGYEFVEANFHRRVGEIDLIMLSPANAQPTRTVVFVEVRFRTSAEFGGAMGSVDWKKQRKMIRAARAWLQRNADSTTLARIDVIAFEPDAPSADSRCNLWKGHPLLWIKNAVEEST